MCEAGNAFARNAPLLAACLFTVPFEKCCFGLRFVPVVLPEQSWRHGAGWEGGREAAGEPLPRALGVRGGSRVPVLLIMSSHTNKESACFKQSCPAEYYDREKNSDSKRKSVNLRNDVSIALRFCRFPLPVRESLLLFSKNQENATKMHYKYREIRDL